VWPLSGEAIFYDQSELEGLVDLDESDEAFASFFFLPPE
jgi:hypothetical protein